MRPLQIHAETNLTASRLRVAKCRRRFGVRTVMTDVTRRARIMRRRRAVSRSESIAPRPSLAKRSAPRVTYAKVGREYSEAVRRVNVSFRREQELSKIPRRR